jgi:hypothetical protein
MEWPYIQVYVVFSKLFQGEINNNNKKVTGRCARIEAGNFSLPASTRQG